MQHPRATPTLLAGLIAAVCSNLASAQAVDNRNGASDAIQEVVVTAQRTQSLESKTPVAMSVITGEALQAAGFDNPTAIGKRLPNVHLDGAADGLKITIRGISNADATDKGDPSAAFMMDGVYIARPQNQATNFFDIDRVEVLRGPQGTLYGRNTTAGVVNVITNAPTQKLEAAVGAEVGNFSSRKTNGMLNVPINDALALRAAFATEKHDGYLRNGQGTSFAPGQDRDSRAARLSAKLAIGRDASLLVRYDYSINHYNPDNFVADTNFFSGVSSGNPVWNGASAGDKLTNRFVPFNGPLEQGRGSNRTSGLAAEFTWDLGPATLYYLGSHREFDLDFLTNYIYRVAPQLTLGVREDFIGSQEQDSHEVRIATNGNGPLSAQAGVYYFHEQSASVYTFHDMALIGLPPYYVFPTDPTIARSRAVFGQATYKVTDRLRATAGLRYTTDEKSRLGSTSFQQGAVFNPATDFQQPNAALIETDKRTWRLGVDYDLTPATFLYAAIATGYKAGGFNDGCVAGTTLGVVCPAAAVVAPQNLFYQPETLKSYEIGAKTRFWHNKASLNATAFKYDYTNLQLSGTAIVQGVPRFITSNAGVASVRGLELDGLVQPTSDDRFNYGLTLLDAHYVSYTPDGVHSWAGKKLDRSPSNVVTLGYERRLRFANHQLRAGINARRSAAFMIGIPSQQLQYRIPAMTVADATFAYQPAGAAWSLGAHVNNLGNKIIPVTVDSFGMSVPSAPRTYGVRFDYRY